MPRCVVCLEPVSYKLAPCWMLCWVLLPLDLVKFLFKNLGLLGVCHGTCKYSRPEKWRGWWALIPGRWKDPSLGPWD